MTVVGALELKGLEYERIDFAVGEHNEQIRAIYGEDRTTVPGMLIDGEPVHGSRAIVAALDALEPEPGLYPSDAVREAELWGEVELQDLARRLCFGALYFRPESMGTFAGGGPLDGPGTDFAIDFIRNTWDYREITAARLYDDLQGLPAKIAHIEALGREGVLGGEQPTAADLQIAPSIRIVLNIADLHPLLNGSTAERIARELFPNYPGEVPAGAFPAGWVPAA
jgi:glutathione S-transferase